jgi:exodeoxyribonuclease V alpha subunit
MGFTCTDSDFLCDEQNEAVRNSMTSDLFILTGGPGSGKTTTIRTILSNFKENYPERTVCLIAPTGKAARRLTESVEGYGTARTIDSLVFAHKIRNEKEVTTYTTETRKAES